MHYNEHFGRRFVTSVHHVRNGRALAVQYHSFFYVLCFVAIVIFPCPFLRGWMKLKGRMLGLDIIMLLFSLLDSLIRMCARKWSKWAQVSRGHANVMHKSGVEFDYMSTTMNPI